MAKSKRGGKAFVSGYTRYKTGNVEEKNRLRKLTKQVVEQANNEQLPLAIKNIRHRRSIPKTPYWSHSMIRVAQIVKKFTGKFDKAMFSADPLVFAAACRTRNQNLFEHFEQPTIKGSMFSMKERTGWTS